MHVPHVQWCAVHTTGTARHVGEQKVCQQDGALPLQFDTAVCHTSNLQVHGWRHCQNQHTMDKHKLLWLIKDNQNYPLFFHNGSSNMRARTVFQLPIFEKPIINTHDQPSWLSCFCSNQIRRMRVFNSGVFQFLEFSCFVDDNHCHPHLLFCFVCLFVFHLFF